MLDSEIVQEHLLNQPLLCVVLLAFVALSLGTFLFSIIFTACRALGNCGAKRYQAHPTNGRRYSLYLPLLIISWVGLAGATIHLLTSGASYWQQGADDVQNGADRAYPLRAISKRQAQERNVFELFEDSDYDGDFEKVGDTSSQAFVIAQPKSLRNFSTDTKNTLKNRLFKIRNRSDLTTSAPQQTDTFVFELTPSGKTSNGDTNSIADQPFQLIRPSARGDKQRHFVKVMAPLTGTSIGHSGDELVTPEELSNEILLDLKDPEKEDVIPASISTTNATSDSTSALAANNTIEQEGEEIFATAENKSTTDEQQPTTIPYVETSTQEAGQRTLSSHSRELQDLLELSDEASIMVANEWPSGKEELLNMTSSELFNMSSTSTSEETTTSPAEEFATTEISTAMDTEFPTTEPATSSATEGMPTADHNGGTYSRGFHNGTTHSRGSDHRVLHNRGDNDGGIIDGSTFNGGNHSGGDCHNNYCKQHFNYHIRGNYDVHYCNDSKINFHFPIFPRKASVLQQKPQFRQKARIGKAKLWK
ncbi:unnamed protein product [Heligmosomoides polygyrus]|uniref:Uncharacterized protein n=1 Tax=Heligmosomoides polygyrus TaxID=6339 RepID=A0A3P7UEF1_HELPZ|nr:unnamed protein product [Heligmosomoides polygyrus]